MLIYGQETTSKGRKCEKLAFVQVNYNHSISELCTTEVNLAMNPLDFRVKKIYRVVRKSWDSAFSKLSENWDD